MRSKKTADPLLFDQEIERTTRRIRRQLRERQNQEQPTSSSSSTAETKTTTPTMDNYQSPRHMLRMGRVAAGTKAPEIKTGLLQLITSIPFAGLDHEDPHTHMIRFYEICG